MSYNMTCEELLRANSIEYRDEESKLRLGSRTYKKDHYTDGLRVHRATTQRLEKHVRNTLIIPDVDGSRLDEWHPNEVWRLKKHYDSAKATPADASTPLWNDYAQDINDLLDEEGDVPTLPPVQKGKMFYENVLLPKIVASAFKDANPDGWEYRDCADGCMKSKHVHALRCFYIQTFEHRVSEEDTATTTIHLAPPIDIPLPEDATLVTIPQGTQRKRMNEAKKRYATPAQKLPEMMATPSTPTSVSQTAPKVSASGVEAGEEGGAEAKPMADDETIIFPDFGSFYAALKCVAPGERLIFLQNVGRNVRNDAWIGLYKGLAKTTNAARKQRRDLGDRFERELSNSLRENENLIQALERHMAWCHINKRSHADAYMGYYISRFRSGDTNIEELHDGTLVKSAP